MNVSTELEGRIRKLDCSYEKLNVESESKHESKLNVECKKVESRVQTQMTNTKCRIDCAKYNVNSCYNGTLNSDGRIIH